MSAMEGAAITDGMAAVATTLFQCPPACWQGLLSEDFTPPVGEWFGLSEEDLPDEPVARRFWAPGSEPQARSVVPRAAPGSVVVIAPPSGWRNLGCGGAPRLEDVVRAISLPGCEVSRGSAVDRPAFADVVTVDAPAACRCVGGCWACPLPDDAPRAFWSRLWEAPGVSVVEHPAFANAVAVVAVVVVGAVVMVGAVVAVGALSWPGGCWARPLSEVLA